MVVEAAKGKDVDVKITTFYQEGGNPEFDAGIKEWINANADAKTNNGGNDMVSAVTVMGYDAYFTALEHFPESVVYLMINVVLLRSYFYAVTFHGERKGFALGFVKIVKCIVSVE